MAYGSKLFKRNEACIDIKRNLLSFTQGYIERSSRKITDICYGCGAIKRDIKCDYCGGIH